MSAGKGGRKVKVLKEGRSAEAFMRACQKLWGRHREMHRVPSCGLLSDSPDLRAADLSSLCTAKEVVPEGGRGSFKGTQLRCSRSQVW